MLKPASGRCNLDCRYCFYRAGHDGHVMSADEAKAILRPLLPVLRAGYPLVFQGGEPLLAGYAFYAELLPFLREQGAAGAICVQTNGTLLDDSFARLFAAQRVLVGVSLDGIAETHNCLRGDFPGVMRGIDALRRAACDFNILTVVTDTLAERIDEIYAFYRREGFVYQQYIPCMTVAGQDRLSPAVYGRFLCRLLDLWEADIRAGRYVEVRLFENLMLMLAGRPPEDCGAGGVCSAQFLIESDGSVYPCDFYVDGDHYLGRLPADSPALLRRRAEESGFTSPLPLPPGCAACPVRAFCRGGCRRYRDADGAFRFCAAWRTFLPIALPRLQSLMRKSLGEA